MNAVVHTKTSKYVFALVITAANAPNRYISFPTESDLLAEYPEAVWAGRASAANRQFYTREQVSP